MFKNGLRLITPGMVGVQKIRQACNLPTVAINGFGRIGKCVLRLAIQNNVNVSLGLYNTYLYPLHDWSIGPIHT